LPFQILTGVSAGAVNIAYLASRAGDPYEGVKTLERLWRGLHSEQVFRTDARALSGIGLKLIRDAVSGGANLGRRAQALLDTTPLAHFLSTHIDFTALRSHVLGGLIDSVAVSATDYASIECLSFFMGGAAITPWRRNRRIGVRQDLTVEHVMASAAIPMLFPPVRLNDRYFGDGCLRNSAPLSPALHLGAERLIIIGVRKSDDPVAARPAGAEPASEFAEAEPNIAGILNAVINAVLLDAVDADVERLARINRTVGLLPASSLSLTSLRPIEWLYLRPSVNIAHIALREVAAMPRLVRYLVRGMGNLADAADVISYLLFEPGYCLSLIDLGYRDVLARRDEVITFLSGGASQAANAADSRYLL
jgi:NTE family protein